MVRWALWIILGSALVVLSGCASIVSHSNYPVVLDTRPSGETVELSDGDGQVLVRGETPLMLNLEASRGYFSSASYTLRTVGSPDGDKVLSIRGKLDGWYFGNILFGGVIGMLIVDPITGAMYRLDQTYILDLNPVPID